QKIKDQKIKDQKIKDQKIKDQKIKDQKIKDQLPLDPPVLIGFFVTPTALAPGLAMNLEACAAFFGPLAPALPPFLLFTGNPMTIGFYQIY
ncbi:hypothetical protein, partial [Sediminibacterium sp.]|uniref:hypothetical protein n=1 Tax=Sediminibacterium sp. TaxID=1917865 RepID=UPI003F71B10D